ncbi:hypothetical protein [Peribacillus frigoritolerans]|uniref:hypothetical protein n=1 Tax=Peribacillus frigoritolerans TaxID=450367 RepID=UPI003D28DEE5
MEVKEWAPIVSATAAAVASIGSWFSIYTQGKREKKNKEAIIVPGIKDIEVTIDNILSDWENKEQLDKRFSKTKIPMWNYGNTPVFKINYCFYLENVNEFLDIKTKSNHYSDYNFLITKDEAHNKLFIDYKNVEYKQGFYTSKIQPYLRDLNYIQANSSAEILLPDYFLILLNHYFLNMESQEAKMPILKLVLFYDDINFKTWRKEFRIFIPNNFNMEVIQQKLTTSFHYEIIQHKKKVKRVTQVQNKKRIEKEKKMYDKAWKIKK